MAIEFKVKRKDVIWSYAAQFLSMGVGLITLPFLLHTLNGDEIGLNYIFMTITSVAVLVDLGFAPQFARNFTYILSGAQTLEKEGIGEKGESVHYGLLKNTLFAAKCTYGILALLAMVLLMGIGTPYVYAVTHHFKAVPDCLMIWLVYALGIFFQIYYTYYTSMMMGAGLIRQQKYTVVANKLLYMALVIGLLYAGWGLMSVSVAQLVSPFLGRMMCHRYFYTPELKMNLARHERGTFREIKEIFLKLWYNAKRTAVMNIGAYAILRFSMFIAGLYLSLVEFGSYGLMIQIVGLLGTVSTTFVQVSQPKFASLRTAGDIKGLLASFSDSIKVFYLLYIVGGVAVVWFGPAVLQLIKAQTVLPSTSILVVYCIIMFLEYNHSNFAILISVNNHVPFAPASIATGIAVCVGIFLVLKFTTLGIMGLILVQGICQLAYQNWKWPMEALKEYSISFWQLMKMGRLAPHHRGA